MTPHKHKRVEKSSLFFISLFIASAAMYLIRCSSEAANSLKGIKESGAHMVTFKIGDDITCPNDERILHVDVGSSHIWAVCTKLSCEP